MSGNDYIFYGGSNDPIALQDNVRRARSKYNSALQVYKNEETRYNSLVNSYNAKAKNISNSRSSKVNFEERLRQIRELIKVLSGEDGQLSSMLGGNVDTFIGTVNDFVGKAAASYARSIIHDNKTAADLNNVLRSKQSHADKYISTAVSELKKEEGRVEQSIKELDDRIKQMDADFSDLTKRVNSTYWSCREKRSAVTTAALQYEDAKKALEKYRREH